MAVLLLSYVYAWATPPCQINEVNVEKAFEVKAYPNPFTDRAFIEFTPVQDDHVTIEIFASNGKFENVIFDENVNALRMYTVTVDGGKIQAGAYILVIRTSKKAYFQKLLLIAYRL